MANVVLNMNMMVDYMRKTLFGILLAIFALGCSVSCSNSSSQGDNAEKVDTIVAKLKLIDSLQNSGTYYHLESWDIGRIVDNGYKKYEILADKHSVEIYVNKLSIKTDTLYYLQLSYWDSSSYSERRETKFIDLEELKSFYTAIDDIKSKYGKDTNHYELYLYQTRTEATLSLRRLINSDYWELKLCSVDISKDDLDELKKLLKQAEDKVKEIRGHLHNRVD